LAVDETTARLQDYSKYPVGYHLRRGTDVMCRVERNFRFARFNFYAGLLSIFRINRDTVEDPQSGKRYEMEGSSGLAATALTGFGYQFSVRSGIKLLAGKKVLSDISRTSTSDGLSREWVVSIGYQFRFGSGL
jgi:hypothetical protein